MIGVSHAKGKYNKRYELRGEKNSSQGARYSSQRSHEAHNNGVAAFAGISSLIQTV